MDDDLEIEEDFVPLQEDFTDIGEDTIEVENEHDLLNGLHEVAWLRSDVLSHDETPYP